MKAIYNLDAIFMYYHFLGLILLWNITSGLSVFQILTGNPRIICKHCELCALFVLDSVHSAFFEIQNDNVHKAPVVTLEEMVSWTILDSIICALQDYIFDNRCLKTFLSTKDYFANCALRG